MIAPEDVHAVFAPVVRTTLAHRAAERIDAAIREGAFRDGERLPPVVAMARRLGVARPTVRAALRQLEAAGRIELRPGAGAFVGRAR